MYGGHVVEDWDRRLTSAYLQIIFQESLLEGQPIFPKFDFRAPTSNINHKQVPGGLAHQNRITCVILTAIGILLGWGF